MERKTKEKKNKKKKKKKKEKKKENENAGNKEGIEERKETNGNDKVL